MGKDRFVCLYHWLLKSEAYRSLNGTARALLVEFYALYNGRNNGELFLSVREAARRLRVAPNTAVKAIAQLQDRGFIRANHVGSFNWKGGNATSWILTEFSFADQLPTKDFMRWRPQAENQKPILVLETDGRKNCDR